MKRFRYYILMWILIISMAGCAIEPELPPVSFSTEPMQTDTAGQTEPSATTDPTQPQVNWPPLAQKHGDEDFVRVADYIPTVLQELAYATTDNFTGYRIYDLTDAYLRYGTLKKLMEVCRELEQQGLGLIIWDGFRPAAAQARLWEICPDATFVSHPVTGNRTHCRGNTVDVTLYSLESGEALRMPTGYDDFTAFADRDYSDCSAEAADNARLLEQTMQKYGFKPYYAEWWHFTDTDSYPIDEFFNPAVPTVWAANCVEYISLRETPGGNACARIPKGDVMELLSWSGKYAMVRYNGLEGYVLTNYIMPENDGYFTQCLDIVAPTNIYTYEQLLADMQTLQDRYPNAVTVDSIGTSELGREIPVLRIGKESAQHHVLLQGAMHGREHMTAWLLMAMADYWLDHGLLGYGDVCYHIIPMVNPDGVVISQTCILNEEQHSIYLSDLEKLYTTRSEGTYAYYWKANGKGVDINRNFSAGWGAQEGSDCPSFQNYPGIRPFSSAEASALRDYTLRYNFGATVSYHATGSVVYYGYGKYSKVNAGSEALANAVYEISGYDLVGNSGLEGGGYKEWAIEELGVPSLTVEIGCEEAALAQREIYSIFVRNYRLLPALARWLQTYEKR